MMLILLMLRMSRSVNPPVLCCDLIFSGLVFPCHGANGVSTEDQERQSKISSLRFFNISHIVPNGF